MSDAKTLAVATAAAVISGGGIGALVSLWLFGRESKREHHTWLRDKREAAFVELMRASNISALRAFMGTPDDESMTSFANAMIPAQIYAPTESARDAIESIQSAFVDMLKAPKRNRERSRVQAAMRTYDREVRRALGIPRKGESGASC